MMGNYIQQVMSALSEFHPNLAPELLEMYALLVLVRGEGVTLKDVHDAWSVWKNQHRPDHHSLIPFEQLSPVVQAMDEKYAKSIRIVASIRRVVEETRARTQGLDSIDCGRYHS
jgi:hypothetical protein